MMAETSGQDLARSFAPVVTGSPRILVLGSMPGRQSLAAQQYYAHPRNAFWPIMQALFGIDSTVPYPSRLSLLGEAGVGLWDVLRECERPGSLDASIRPQSIVANDFGKLFADYPSIKAIFFNGNAAAKAFNKHVAPILTKHPVPATCSLPSTSPAHAAMSLRQKTDAWREAIMPYFAHR